MKLWEEAVNINSGSMNFDGVYKVGQLFKARFDALGFTTRWVDGKPFNRAGHLIAEHKGKPTERQSCLSVIWTPYLNCPVHFKVSSGSTIRLCMARALAT